MNKKLCPYVEHIPLTGEGFEAWEVIQRCSGQLNFYPNGIIAGFDFLTIIEVTKALGYNLQAMLYLLNYAELGLLGAIQTYQKT